MNLEMKNGRLLVKRVDEQKKEDLVIYTNEQKHKSYTGEIVAHCVEDGFEIGDKIIFSEFAGEEMVVDGKKYIVLDGENVVAKVLA
jgi:co-chaperonin GroES (HSP10)